MVPYLIAQNYKDGLIFSQFFFTATTIGRATPTTEGILNSVPLSTKGAKSLPWAENWNFSPLTVNNLFKFSTQWSNLTPFVGNGTEVKRLSEIKPPVAQI